MDWFESILEDKTRGLVDGVITINKYSKLPKSATMSSVF